MTKEEFASSLELLVYSVERWVKLGGSELVQIHFYSSKEDCEEDVYSIVDFEEKDFFIRDGGGIRLEDKPVIDLIFKYFKELENKD